MQLYIPTISQSSASRFGKARPLTLKEKFEQKVKGLHKPTHGVYHLPYSYMTEPMFTPPSVADKLLKAVKAKIAKNRENLITALWYSPGALLGLTSAWIAIPKQPNPAPILDGSACIAKAEKMIQTLPNTYDERVALKGAKKDAVLQQEADLKELLRVNQERYNQYIDANRVDPGEKFITGLPDNVKVLGATSQKTVAYGSAFTKAFLKSVLETGSVNQAMEAASGFSQISGTYLEEKYKFYIPPQIQKAVVTKRNSADWQQGMNIKDNNNPNVKRVMILVWDNDYRKKNPIDFGKEAKKFKDVFNNHATTYQDSSGKMHLKWDGIRIDKTIVVSPENGKVSATEIETAYKQAEAFAEEERNKAIAQGKNPDDLIFEDLEGWFGHGGSTKQTTPIPNPINAYPAPSGTIRIPLFSAIASNLTNEYYHQLQRQDCPEKVVFYSFDKEGKEIELTSHPHFQPQINEISAMFAQHMTDYLAAHQEEEKRVEAKRKLITDNRDREGVMDFTFHTLSDQIPESTMNNWSRNQMRRFRIFRIFSSCHSGAATAQADEENKQKKTPLA